MQTHVTSCHLYEMFVTITVRTIPEPVCKMKTKDHVHYASGVVKPHVNKIIGDCI